MGARGKSKLFANAAVATLAGAQHRGASAKELKGTVPSRSAQDPASFLGTPGVDERKRPGTAGQGGDGQKASCLRLLLLRLTATAAHIGTHPMVVRALLEAVLLVIVLPAPLGIPL